DRPLAGGGPEFSPSRARSWHGLLTVPPPPVSPAPRAPFPGARKSGCESPVLSPAAPATGKGCRSLLPAASLPISLPHRAAPAPNPPITTPAQIASASPAACPPDTDR